ncbi:STAS domain-containing protein [Streptomyces avicenniae]|uniref:STAS domain-containing protein n=1 Tax=Streptomyces avicenniae TaxID=500153 RepID=UPI00069C479E|nr:STAS domain-containing protein [Streptomyces avicenniae]
MHDFTLTTTSTAGSVVMAPHGELDYDTLSDIEDALTRLPVSAGPVVLDMTGVSFMDLAGLRLAYLLANEEPVAGRIVMARGWRPQPEKLMRLVDLPRPCGRCAL